MDLQVCLHRANGRTRAGSGAARPPEPPTPLTARELEILSGLAAGLSDREVALRVMLFEPALRATLRSIYQKLGVRTRHEAVACVAGYRSDS